jgi:hypothetical protein
MDSEFLMPWIISRLHRVVSLYLSCISRCGIPFDFEDIKGGLLYDGEPG